MVSINSILVILDPTSDKQHALTRAARIGKRRGSSIRAYLCVYSNMETNDPDILKKVELSRYEWWVKQFIEPIQAEGIDVDIQIEWNSDWRTAIAQAVKKVEYDLIIKPSHRRSRAKRIMMTSSDLTLFESANCPVLLMNTQEYEDPKNILIAIDPKRQGARDKKILETIVEHGKAIAEAHKDSELHAVYAYSTQDEYQHVTDVAKLVGIDTSRVHILGGGPEEVIVKVARDIDANLIIIGLSTKSVLANRVFGTTADWLLNNIDHDIQVIVN